jgi:hypothetical protein
VVLDRASGRQRAALRCFVTVERSARERRAGVHRDQVRLGVPRPSGRRPDGRLARDRSRLPGDQCLVAAVFDDVERPGAGGRSNVQHMTSIHQRTRTRGSPEGRDGGWWSARRRGAASTHHATPRRDSRFSERHLQEREYSVPTLVARRPDDPAQRVDRPRTGRRAAPAGRAEASLTCPRLSRGQGPPGSVGTCSEANALALEFEHCIHLAGGDPSCPPGRTRSVLLSEVQTR